MDAWALALWLIPWALTTASCCIVLRVVRRLELRLDSVTEPHVDGDAGGNATDAEKRPDPINEGIENLMTYAVGGKTGLEREGA